MSVKRNQIFVIKMPFARITWVHMNVNAKPATPVEIPHCMKPFDLTSSSVAADAPVLAMSPAAAADRAILDRVFKDPFSIKSFFI